MIGQQMRFIDTAFGTVFGKYRHKSLAERALGEQAAQKIRDAPGGNKSIIGHARAESVGGNDLKDEPSNAR